MNYKPACTCSSFDSLNHRLKHLRNCVEGATLREFAERVSEEMEGGGVSYGAVNNYETPEKKEPRADYIVAVKRAFPSVRMDWLLFGEGAPFRSLSDRIEGEGVEPATLEDAVRGVETTRPGWGPAATRVWRELVSRYTAACPDELSHGQQLELWSDVDRLILRPLETWGFRSRDDLSDAEFTQYVFSLVGALLQVVPDQSEGDPAEERFSELSVEE